MKITKKRLSELHLSPKNVRNHNQKQIEELAKAIDAFGVIRPIVCDEKGEILCGNGLYEALTAKGYDTVECVVMSGLSERQKRKLMLADNKIYTLGTDNYDIIEEFLTDFGADDDFAVPGFDADILESMYGVRSVEREAQSLPSVPDYAVTQNNASMQDEEPPTPSAHVQEERAQAIQRRIIICPHCGGTIEL